MDNRWYKIKNNLKEKRYSLYCFGTWSIFFTVLYILTKIFNSSLCPIKNLFGISCFGCGMTRAFICILELNLISAFQYNVLSIPLFFAIFLYIIIFCLDIFFSKNIIKKIDTLLSKKFMYVIYVLLLCIGTYLNNL